MRVSDLQHMLADVQKQHGDIEVFCGERPIGALAVLPASSTTGRQKAVSIILRERRDATRAP